MTASPTDDIDREADNEIACCLNLATPRSFFLFAGAGSGKTRSLIGALKHAQATSGTHLRLRGQRVAVITYTNAACDEIKRRLEFDPVIDVSTIHSFAWSLIGGLNHDIREWLRSELHIEIERLRAEEAKGRAGTKASMTRLSQIESSSKRLQSLDGIRKFIYSPTGDNRTRDSLSHSEVIRMTAHFLREKPAMQSILVGRYPFLLIDESQDTNKLLIDAFFAIQSSHSQCFCLGLFGDMMQRIYADGKDGLGQDLPSDWARPAKRVNHRCPTRIVELINRVRQPVDGQQQVARSDAPAGHARLFVLSSDIPDKPAVEREIASRMATIAGDEAWCSPDAYKTLTLEHRMAARRMGFLDLFAALYEVESFRTGLLAGELPILRFFTEEVLPLVQASMAGDRFRIARLLRSLSPILSVERMRAESDQRQQLQRAQLALDALMHLFASHGDPTFGDILRNVAHSELLQIPDALRPGVDLIQAASPAPDAQAENADPPTSRTAAIEAFLESSFSQAERYRSYVGGSAPFDTHQGVKGLEFPRVMVIMDDSEARGFLFKYDKLFGASPVSDTTAATTRRLFYVTCSRAERSLALVAYSSDPARVKQHVLAEDWFSPEEVHVGPLA